MRFVAAHSLLIFAAPALFAAPVPKELKADYKFEGLWRVESIVANGTPVVREPAEYWTVDAKSIVMMHEGSEPPAGKTGHLQLTFDQAAGTLVYKLINGNIPECLGRYRVSGTTLIIAIDLNGGRPATVETGSGIYVWQLKRVESEGAK